MIAFARMTADVGGFEFGDGEMQVTFCGRERAMTEDLLDVAQVRFVL